jgi:hypothetical protein
LPERVGRGVALQFVFGTYMAQVAEVEVSKRGAVRVDRKLEEEQRTFQVEDRAPFATHSVSVWVHSP